MTPLLNASRSSRILSPTPDFSMAMSRIRWTRRAALVVVPIAFALAGACDSGAARERAPISETAIAIPGGDSVLFAQVSTGKMSASKVVTAGWRALRVNRTDNASHILVAFGIDPSLSVASFVAALDSFPNTPAGAVALGGPEGITNEVLLRLPAGRVIVACVSRAEDGHRHATKGELAEVEIKPAVVTSIADSAPPESSVIDVPLSDFAFLGLEQIPAATRYLRVRNRGQQDHQLRIVRLKEGKNIADWVKDPDGTSEAEGAFGMARLGSPHDAYLPVSLRPGAYVFFCLVADPASKKPHVEMGMLKQIFVTP